MSIYITSILPDQASNRRLLMDIYENDIFVHFLVCVPAISAQAWRYYRFVTGTITMVLCRARLPCNMGSLPRHFHGTSTGPLYSVC